MIALEEVDHERPGRTGLSLSPAWRLHGAKVPRLNVRQCFCGRGAAEAGMRTVKGVVAQNSTDGGFQLEVGEERNGRAQIEQAVLERAPEAFQLGIGAVVVSRAEAKVDIARVDVLLELKAAVEAAISWVSEMSRIFDASVCRRFEALLVENGWRKKGVGTFLKPGEAGVFGMIWLVEGASHLKGTFMPRLSIGMEAIGDDVAVLSTDLNSRTTPARTEWYSWAQPELSDAVSAAIGDLRESGLPWLESHLSWSGLTAALVARLSKLGGPDSNTLRFLSHAYEAQGQFPQALIAWHRYKANLNRLVEGSDADRAIAARERALSSRISSE